MGRRQFRVLYGDFLRRLVDIQTLSTHARGDASTLFGQFASLLIFLSLLFSAPSLYFDGKVAVPGQGFLLGVWSLQHFLIATTMLLVGIFAVLTWNSVFPDKGDVMILTPLPVRTRTIFLAKIAAVASGLALLVVTLHALAGIAWPFAFNKRLPAQVLTDFAAQRALPPVNAAQMQAVLDRDLEPLRRQGAFARGGVSIGIVTRGVRRVFAYGAAKPDSIFEIGSVTKTFTALALAQMVQEGLVTLHEPVRELLPRGTADKPDGQEITLLDLATHHSGLPRMPSGFYRKKEDDPFADFHVADLYDYMARHGVKKPADVSFDYSNLAVGLLGQVLADRAHMSYAELLKTKVTGPLGLKDTVVLLSSEQRRRFIQGYNGRGEGPDGFRWAAHGYGDPVPPTTLDGIAGAGAVKSTASDLLKFAEENLHPDTYGGALSAALKLSHVTRAAMDDSAANAEFIPAGTRIALIWWRTPDGCYMHGGAMPGYTASVLFNPERNWAIVVLSNMGGGGLISADLISEHIRQRLEGLPALSLAPVQIPATGGFASLLRMFVAYWVTMLTAGAFIYCAVLGLQGLMAGLLPRQMFLRLSSLLQMIVFCGIVSAYFLQPAIAAPNLFDPHNAGPPIWSPSYWFLGLLQQLNGSPALGAYAKRAWLAIGATVAATLCAYALCYFRTLRKIVEQPDILPRTRQHWLSTLRRWPNTRHRWSPRLGTGFEGAIVQFSMRTLLRSRQHLLLVAFYLGIGFGATVLLLKSPVAKAMVALSVTDPLHQVSAPLLAASLVLMGFWVAGVRAVFSLPSEAGANWIFRVAPLPAGRALLDGVRRSLWMLAVCPALMVSACVFLSCWPLEAALEHLILLALFGLALTEVCLQGVRKIPFTCPWLPGKSNFHISFWLCILLVLEIVLRVAELERMSLAKPGVWAMTAIVLTAAWLVLLARNSQASRAEWMTPQFEEQPSWELTTLDLPR